MGVAQVQEMTLSNKHAIQRNALKGLSLLIRLVHTAEPEPLRMVVNHVTVDFSHRAVRNCAAKQSV